MPFYLSYYSKHNYCSMFAVNCQQFFVKFDIKHVDLGKKLQKNTNFTAVRQKSKRYPIPKSLFGVVCPTRDTFLGHDYRCIFRTTR